jgi:hypothetical protein
MEARDGSGPCPLFEFGPSAVRGVVLGDGKHRSCLWRRLASWKWWWSITFDHPSVRARSMVGSMGTWSARAWAVGGVSHGRILRESSEI